MRETRVLEALRALAENDRQMAASPAVEARLREAVRARRARHAWRMRFRTAVGLLAAAAAAFMIVIVTPQRSVTSHRRYEAATPPPATTAAAVSPSVIRQPAQPRGQSTAPLQRGRLRPRPAKHVPQGAQPDDPRGHEVATDFFALMDPAPPLGRGQILRVQLPAQAMLAVGLPVSEDRLAGMVQADVLVGEEGLPRAIRFIRFEAN